MALHFSQCRWHVKLNVLHVYFIQNFISNTNYVSTVLYLSDNFIYITNCMLKQLDFQSIFTQLLYILKLMSL